MSDNHGEKGKHIPIFLSQVICLEELSIDIFSGSAIGPEIWIDIDRQLDMPKFSNLRRLNFFFPPNFVGKDRAFIEEMLPLCTRRGILRFADNGGHTH
jgi:hypothetical protein